MSGQVWEGVTNVTRTDPGYCQFFDEFGCHEQPRTARGAA